MKHIPSNLMALAALSLAACGGGGGSANDASSTAPAPLTYPAGGIYAPVLKVQGSTSKPAVGLSLVHPDDPSVEYVLESGAASITDTFMLYSGTVVAGAGRVENLKPHSLLYIAGGQLRRISLTANGAAPASQVKTAMGGNFCGFKTDAISINYSSPDSTSVFANLTGPADTCGTAGSEVISVTYDTTADALKTSLIVGGSLYILRDPVTLAPANSLQSLGVVVDGKYFGLIPSSASTPARQFRRMIASSPGIALMEIGSTDADSQLALVSTANHSSQEFDKALTGGGNWQLIGHDATTFYVYRNSGSSTLSSWSVVKITKSQPTATRIASGSGLLANVAIGESLLYLTVQQASSNKLYSLSKNTSQLAEMESNPVTALTTVLTSASGVHQFWRVSGLGANLSSRIDMMDEFGNLRATAANAMPLAMVEPTSINPFRSENRTRFIYASGLGGVGYADANIVSFDTSVAGASPVAIGKLPGATAFAGTTVFASAPMALSNFATGQVTSSRDGNFVAGGAKVFSFKTDTANSLVLTGTTR